MFVLLCLMDVERNQEARAKFEKLFPPAPTLREIAKKTKIAVSDLSSFRSGYNFGDKRLNRLEKYLNENNGTS